MPCRGCALVILMKFLHQSEHEGVQERSYGQIQGFREMVDVCGLYDLGFEGRRWTFEKKVTGGSYCRVRLDRALATPVWNSLFLSAMVRNLAAAASDHGPILLRWRQETGGNRKQKGKKLFKYETMWETHEDFSSWLTETWQGEGKARAVQELQQKIAVVTSKMEGWGRTTFGNVHL